MPSEEQDIMTVEERQILSEVPKTIQQVMKDVVVYVEVHYEADNRSDGIKKVIAQLGAKVNNKLLRYQIKPYRLNKLCLQLVFCSQKYDARCVQRWSSVHVQKSKAVGHSNRINSLD